MKFTLRETDRICDNTKPNLNRIRGTVKSINRYTCQLTLNASGNRPKIIHKGIQFAIESIQGDEMVISFIKFVDSDSMRRGSYFNLKKNINNEQEY